MDKTDQSFALRMEFTKELLREMSDRRMVLAVAPAGTLLMGPRERVTDHDRLRVGKFSTEILTLLVIAVAKQ